MVQWYLPSIAQLVERWTVVGSRAEIHRSLVQIRLEGETFSTSFFHKCQAQFWSTRYNLGDIYIDACQNKCEKRKQKCAKTVSNNQSSIV